MRCTDAGDRGDAVAQPGCRDHGRCRCAMLRDVGADLSRPDCLPGPAAAGNRLGNTAPAGTGFTTLVRLDAPVGCESSAISPAATRPGWPRRTGVMGANESFFSCSRDANGV